MSNIVMSSDGTDMLCSLNLISDNVTTIYTDGSCLGNGKDTNTGGFGVIVLDKDQKVMVSYNKSSENTTNNREELKAILWAFMQFGVDKDHFFIPTVYSDSAYCVNTFNNWMFTWADKGWLKSDNKTPENLDLIQEYYNLYNQGKRINLQKIKGHQGHQWNELADSLATGKMTSKEVIEKYGRNS